MRLDHVVMVCIDSSPNLVMADSADRVEAGVVEELASELIEGHGLGLVLRPYEGSSNDDLAIAAE
jgi:hypothetical protein